METAKTDQLLKQVPPRLRGLTEATIVGFLMFAFSLLVLVGYILGYRKVLGMLGIPHHPLRSTLHSVALPLAYGAGPVVAFLYGYRRQPHSFVSTWAGMFLGLYASGSLAQVVLPLLIRNYPRSSGRTVGPVQETLALMVAALVPTLLTMYGQRRGLRRRKAEAALPRTSETNEPADEPTENPAAI